MKKVLNKVVGLSIVCCFGLNANAFDYDNNLTIGFSGLNMNYIEYDSNGAFLDSEKSSLNEIYGVDASLTFPLSQRVNTNLYGSYHSGSTVYNGSTWGGTSVSVTHEDVSIITMEGTIDYDLIKKSNGTPLSFKVKTGVGYREWDRGLSNHIGDYNEVYSWAYGIIGTSVSYDISKVLNVGFGFDYKKSFYGNMDVNLDSKFKIPLDDIDGMTFTIPVEYKVSKSFSLVTEAKYEIWNIAKSDLTTVRIGGINASVYEPESETKNTYLGLKAKFSF